MADVNLLMVVDDKARSSIAQVARSAEAQGLRVQQTLESIGTIAGVGDSSLVERLSQIEGVKTVREERRYQLPPLDERIPQ